jgi:hypothetical protein
MSILEKFIKWGPGKDMDRNGNKNEVLEPENKDKGYIDEDEWLVIQNDPGFKKAMEYNLENKSSEDDLGSWTTSWFSEPEPLDFNNSLEGEKPFKQQGNPDLEDEVPFEEQDLSLEWKKPEMAELIKDMPEYSIEEFSHMQECAKYAYYCFEKNRKDIPRPTFSNGSNMNDDQIKKLALEYSNLEKNNRSVFAELKTALGEWNKQKGLKWEYRPYKGKDSWGAKKGDVVYISNENPDFFFHNDDNEIYFKSTGKFNPQKGSVKELNFVQLQTPIVH